MDRIVYYVSTFLAILIVLPIHEFAHAFVAVKCGDLTPKLNGRLTLNPLKHFDLYGLICMLLVRFGWAKPVPINPNNFNKPKRDIILVSSAGVVANYLLAFLMYPLSVLLIRFFALHANLGIVSEMIYMSVYNVYFLSVCFFVFNLLPIFPLDGFRILEGFCSPYNKVVQFLRNYGQYILLGLVLLSFVSSMLNLPQINILGNYLTTLVNYVAWPIKAFWGLIL